MKKKFTIKEEIWKKINGFNYEVSTKGSVRNIKIIEYKNKINELLNLGYNISKISKELCISRTTVYRYKDSEIIDYMLNPVKNKHGYLNVRLYKDKEFYDFRVHRLVAMSFIENVNNKPQVNHIDGDKTNNNVNNLEWVNNSENQIHSVLIGTHISWKKGMFKLSIDDYYYIIKLLDYGISIKDISKIFNVSVPTIYSTIKRNKCSV